MSNVHCVQLSPALAIDDTKFVHIANIHIYVLLLYNTYIYTYLMLYVRQSYVIIYGTLIIF